MELKGDMTHGLAPEPMSEPCGKFFLEQANHYTFQYFLLDLVRHRDEAKRTALETLATLSRTTEEERQRYTDELAREAYSTFRAYRGFTDIICENWLCRTVDNYIAYVSELLSLIFKRVLKRSERPRPVGLYQRSSKHKMLGQTRQKQPTRLLLLNTL